MKLSAFITLPLLLTAVPLCAQPTPTLEDLHWLVGTWAFEKTANAYEEWKIANDSTLTGRSYKVNGKDTLVSETVEIVRKHQVFWYIPTVSNQNEGKPVPFRLITGDATQLTFENKAHDFPHRINYFKDGHDVMRVWVEGEVNGQIKKVNFDMRRVRE